MTSLASASTLSFNPNIQISLVESNHNQYHTQLFSSLTPMWARLQHQPYCFDDNACDKAPYPEIPITFLF
ncbi:hypothetical protein H9Q69_007124 [Fusarium xylarioides]|nr:hypothetical protein H9Q70_001350 [Fusarium xylarioides]KAG5793840.1 hypothetical protein H9Q69_007124 [Fusarium xylarioides]